MAENRQTHLRVVRIGRTNQSHVDVAREDYWAELRALRDERERLRAG